MLMCDGHVASKVYTDPGTLIGHPWSRRVSGMQVVARQPVVILATAHLLPEDLHPDLLRYISGPGPLFSAQQGIHASSQPPLQQALRNVVLLRRDLPAPEPSPARPLPDPNLGSAAQTCQSCLFRHCPSLPSHRKRTRWDCSDAFQCPMLRALRMQGM